MTCVLSLFLSLFPSLVLLGFDVLLQPSLLSSSSFLIFDLDFLVSFALLLFVFPVVTFLVSCPVFLVINGHLSSSLLFCLDTSSLSLVTLSLTPHLHLSLDLCDISSFSFILSLQTLSPHHHFLISRSWSSIMVWFPNSHLLRLRGSGFWRRDSSIFHCRLHHLCDIFLCLFLSMLAKVFMGVDRNRREETHAYGSLWSWC